eukprot:1161667-Pelagomonas_calceolata.AAC.1
MKIGSDDQLAQHNLQIPAHASNRTTSSYLFPRKFPKKSSLTSSHPDTVLITTYHAKPTSSSLSSSSSLCRHDTSQKTSAVTRVRQPALDSRAPHQLSANQRHVHLIEIKYFEDTRPGQQLEAAQWQHTELCKDISGEAVTLHTILLGVGRTYYVIVP